MTDLATADRYTTALLTALRPDPIQTIADWADAHVQLPSSHSSEAGQWRTSRTPFWREVMDCLSPSHPCTKVVLMKSHQIGGTQCAVNWMGYVIDRAPGPMMIVEPTVDVAQKLSKQKVQPMLELTPVLRGKVKEARARDSGNTILVKEFLGGSLVFAGSNSGVGLRSVSVRYLVLDEVDAYEASAGHEGHPVQLAENRTSTFARRKIFMLSTPLEAITSVIEPAYTEGSRGHYLVPCPHCGHRQWLRFGNFVFTFDGVKKPHDACFRCEGCAQLIPEHHKTCMLDHGQWEHEDPDNPVRSFLINSFYMPYGWPLSWGEIARRWIASKHKLDLGNPDDHKVTITTILAETWQEVGEKVQHNTLWERREDYPAPCPEGVLILTAAIDVQDDRLEAEIVGWGIEEESWSIDYRRFAGIPSQPLVWADVTTWLTQRWTHESGVALRVEQVVVDTGGHYTKEAYAFVRTYRGGRIAAIKGSPNLGAPLIPPRPTRAKKSRMWLWHIGTIAGKDTLFSRLKLTDFGPGYIHHPRRDTYDQEFFEQLGSEEKVKKYASGVLQGYYYKKTRARNEALDLKVYNMVALAILNPPPFEELAGRLTREAEAVRTPPADVSPPAPVPKSLQSAPVARKGFVKGWR